MMQRKISSFFSRFSKNQEKSKSKSKNSKSVEKDDTSCDASTVQELSEHVNTSVNNVKKP